MSTRETLRGYRYLVGGSITYSAGVVASSGYEMQRAVLDESTPLAEAFQRINVLLSRSGLPMTSLCAVELRSAAAVPREEFDAFNRIYFDLLDSYGLITDGSSPLARTNVAQLISPPDCTSVHAFSYVVPAEGRATRSYIVSGSSEVPESNASAVVCLDRCDPAGRREKVTWVVDEIRRRIEALSVPEGPSFVAVHSRFGLDIDMKCKVWSLLGSEGRAGYVDAPSVPPVLGLDFEVEARRIVGAGRF